MFVAAISGGAEVGCEVGENFTSVGLVAVAAAAVAAVAAVAVAADSC